ncbi:hypothetical protein KIH07_17310 [Hydrogenophaga taeniospiralis]|uniref:hypothetical protein n=1 Tax=Hydrogenophaga taeniospiralis TaxID=65656 RepID=UPI001CFAB3F9|nr:hypothetical protein [Hydrogenophaga taeniospiralis]MCB4365501.1 hypothetical protein [Hydrogenophaga taeniospiralis]
MNFQMVEAMLKHLNATASVHGPVSQLTERVEAQREAVHRKTMGELAGRMVTHMLQAPPEHQTPDEVTEPWVGFRFSVEADAQFVDQHDQEMLALVDARNDLIHHFLARWNSSVDGDAEEALAYLDAQRDETFRMLDRLRGWVTAMDESRKQLAAFMASPEGVRQMELGFLQNSRLVAMLGEIALNAARSDGWALLSTARNLIKRNAPTETENLQKRYGHQSLKGILLAAEYFDVMDEALPNGGYRTIYRINDRYTLQMGQSDASEQTSETEGRPVVNQIDNLRPVTDR